MWQMGGVGPMAGQAHHFLKYAPAMDPPHDLSYTKDRYRTVGDALVRCHEPTTGKPRLCRWRFLFRCGPGSAYGAAIQQSIEDKPQLERWLVAVKSRDTVQRGRSLASARHNNLQTAKKAQELLIKRTV